MLAETVRVQATNGPKKHGEIIAVVKMDAAGKIAKRKHRLKAVSMESRIANG